MVSIHEYNKRWAETFAEKAKAREEELAKGTQPTRKPSAGVIGDTPLANYLRKVLDE
jgi:hypothetical protein